VLRGEDVGLLAVEVVEQRDAGVAVRVVLDGRDLRRHAVLVPAEVDDAVARLVAAAAVAGGLAAEGVAAARLRLGRQQRLLRRLLGGLREVGDGLEPAAGAGGLALAECHVYASNKGIDSPAARVTSARLESGLVPYLPVLRSRTRLPLRLSVFTLTTFTLKMSRTAS